MQQYLRKVKVSIKGKGGNLKINHDEDTDRQLKVEFTISKGISSTANSANIEIYNLNESHRNAIGKELDEITLEAGYKPPSGGSNVGVIFKGQIRDFEHKQKGVDIITEIRCGEGDKALRKATISKTYKAGTEVKEVVEGINKELEKEGIDKGEWKFPDDMPKFKRPYTVCGSCKRELDTLGRGKNFYWSIQNGVLEIIPADGFIGGIVLISPQTGMIGTPTITDTGVKCVALLNPEIRPNRRVRIESKTLEMNAKSGEYRVGEVTYSGNNRDGDMVVHIVGESVKGGGGTKDAGGKEKVDEGEVTNVAQDAATHNYRGDT